MYNINWNYLTGGVMLNRIIGADKQYLKLFNCVPKLNCYCYIAMLEII